MRNWAGTILGQLGIILGIILMVPFISQYFFTEALSANSQEAFLGFIICLLVVQYLFLSVKKTHWSNKFGGEANWFKARNLTGIAALALAFMHTDFNISATTHGLALLLAMLIVLPGIVSSTVFRMFPNQIRKMFPWADKDYLLEMMKEQETELLVTSAKVSAHLNHLTWEHILEDNYKEATCSIKTNMFQLDSGVIDSIEFMKALAEQRRGYRGLEETTLDQYKSLLDERIASIVELKRANYFLDVLSRSSVYKKAIVVVFFILLALHGVNYM